MKNNNKIAIIALAAGIMLTIGSKSSAVNFYDTLGTKYEGATERLAEIEVVSGTSKNVFTPEAKVTRAEFAKMLVNASLKPAEIAALVTDDAEINFKDIDKDEWYYKYVVAAVNNGLMNGYEDGTFKPDNNITYAEISKMVTLALGHVYLRSDDPRGWQAEYVDKMYEIGAFRYTKFNSINDPATRGDVANIIWNMLKSNTWKMIYRNETTGFSYVDSYKTLFEQKVVDHVLLANVEIQGFRELNGELYVTILGRNYRLFDQSAVYSFSMIGGRSDVILKRVEYPGKEQRLEAVGISTDIEAKLHSGTYKQLINEGFTMSNKTKLGKDTDYGFIYHYEDQSASDRTIGVNMSEFVIVDKIKIDDERPKDTNKDKDVSHTSTSNEFEDDIISFRYDKEIDTFTRTIDINEGKMKIENGSVLFRGNKRIEWSELKEGDILVEIAKNQYYFIATTTTKEVILESYSNKKGDYKITTANGDYATYENTRYQSYLTDDYVYFNKMKSDDLKKLVGKKLRITLDLSERVVKIVLVEDEYKYSDLNFGIYSSFANTSSKEDDKDKEGNTYARLYIRQEERDKVFRTSLKNVDLDPGSLVKYTYDDKKTNIVKSVSAISGKTELTKKIRIEKFKTSDLQSKVKYFEDEGLKITAIKYHYAFGKYEKPTGYDVEKVSISEYLGINDDTNTTSYAIMDADDYIKEIIYMDDTEKSSIYYGLVTRIYKPKETSEKKDTSVHVVVKVIGIRQEQDYVLNGMILFDVGDFIKFELSSKENITFIEKYSLSSLGYYKDLKVEDAIYDKNKKVISYNLSDNGTLDIENWEIDSKGKEYNLNAYKLFLLTLSKEENTYSIFQMTVVTRNNIKLQAGDMLAIDEIDGAIVIYRGFNN